MSETPPRKNDLLQLVEEGTLTPEQAEAILPEDSKPPVSTLLDQSKTSCNRTRRFEPRRSAVLDLVEDDVLSEEQAADILGVPADAVSETVE